MRTGAPMANFRPGSVIKVPFPYTDRATRQRRPALVVGTPGEDYGLLWVAMITSAENRPWPCDVAIADHQASGLPAPSTVRPAKIATIEKADAEPLGELPPKEFAAVKRFLREAFAL